MGPPQRTAAPNGRQRVHNPLAGDLALTGDALELPGDGLTLITYTAAADSHAQEQLDFLASWSANRQHGQSDHSPSRSTRAASSEDR